MIDPLIERLPCGAEVPPLLEQVADGRASRLSSHQARCPHCLTVLGQLSARWASVRELASRPVLAPPGLVARAMRLVHAVAARGEPLVLTAERGVTRVPPWVLARVASLAASRVPGVRHAQAQATEVVPGHPTGSWARMQLEITLEYGSAMNDVAEAVRQVVSVELQTFAGVASSAVDVIVEDVTSGA